MKSNSISYLPRPFCNKAIIAFIVALGLCTIIFRVAPLPWLWVLFGFIEVLGFFFFTNLLSKNWNQITNGLFIRKLFWYSLIIRVIWVVFSYFFFIAQTGKPFDFVAADSYSYHNWAIEASDAFSRKGFSQFFESRGGYSDLGYPIYLTLVYVVFGQSIIIARLLFAVIGAWSCVLIYRLAKRNFGEAPARIAALLAMLLPNLIYYTGLHLKEPLMVFLIIAFIERSDEFLRNKQLRLVDMILIALIGGVLFFFRTVLGISALFALFSSLVFSTIKIGNWGKRILLGSWVIVLIWVLFSARIQYEIDYLIENIDAQEQNMRYRAEREGGNKLSEYGSVFVFVPFMFVAPFPTFVNIEPQKQQMLLAGGYFVRNIYSFFVILALILLVKRRMLKKHVLILSFIMAYLAILARSPYALSERFHMPVVPFLLILGAYGITQLNIKNKKYYTPYLIMIIIIVLGWNWFKLAGRGMV